MIREIVWRKMQAQEELGFCQSSKIGTVKEELLSSKRKSKIGKVEKVKSQLLSSVQFSHLVMSNSLWPDGLQHIRLPSPSPNPEASSNSSIELVIASDHLILCRLLLQLPSIFPSMRVFSNGSVLHIRWAKYWRLSFSISPSNEYSGLFFCRIHWFDLLAVKGTGLIHLQSKY